MAKQTVLFLVLACASKLLSEANSGAVSTYKGAAQLLITSKKSQDVLSDSKSGESSETFRGLKEPIDPARDAELQKRSPPPAVRALDEPAWRSFDLFEDPSVVRATVTPSEHVTAVSLRAGGSATPKTPRRAVNKALGPSRRGPRGEGNPCCDDTHPVLLDSRVAMSGKALRSTEWASLSDEDGGSGTARQQEERHSRQRRSWLWNQFFVIEEYQGPEPVLIGRLHTDMDGGDGRTKYILEGEGVGSVFVIDEKTGNIHVTKSLDREEKDQYRLVATATDRQTGHALEPSSQFIIRVQDINDNPPIFKDEPYVATVPEMANIGTSIIQVTATDADDPTYGNSAKLVYAIAQGQQYFSVDPQTGILRTAVPDMDREAQAEYQVILEAKDMGGHLGGMSGTTTVTVRLADVNDNAPRFRRSAWSFSVSELAAPGVEVGRLSATDADLDDNALLAFTILDGEERDTFNISTRDQEAVLVLNKLLDYESRSAYSFTVEVANPVMDARFLRRGPFKDRASVRVMVLNADEPPRFSRARYRLDVSENCPPVCSVGRVSAVDPDTGQSSNIRYSIDPQSDPEALFRIASDTGFITTVTELDREREQWHNITVIATQRDNPNLVTRVVVAIETLDQNDNAPELDRQYTTSVCDSSAPGQVVQMLRAVDKDQGGQDTTAVHFSIPPESSSALNLTIRESGGVTASLVLQSTLQPLPGFAPSLLTLYVPVVLRDGASGLTNTGTVTVTVCPCMRGGMQTEDRGRQRDRGWERHTVCLPLPSSSPSLIFSMVTLLALLACITTMLVVCALSLSLRNRKRDSLSPLEEDEIRENIIRYDDEGGGEADTAAFDMAALQSMHRVQRMQDSRNIWYTQPNAPRARTYSWGRNPRPIPEHRRPGSAPMYGRFCYGVHTLPVLHDCPQGPLEAGLQLTQLGYGLPGSHLANHPPLVIQNQATFDLVEPRPAHIIHPAAAAAAAVSAEMNPTGRERAEQRLVGDTSSDQDGGNESNSEVKPSQNQEPSQTPSTELLLTNKRVTPTFSDPSESSALSQASSMSTQQDGTPGSSQTHTSTGATSSALDELDTDSSIPSVSERLETNCVGLTDAQKSCATLSGRDNYSIVGSLTQRSGVFPGSGSSGGLYPGGAQLLNMYGLGRRDLTPQMPAFSLPGAPNRGGRQERAADGVVGAAHSLPLRMEEFLKFRLNQVTSDLSQPPYDSLQTYEFEGRDSRAESLSSLESEVETEELGEEGEGAGAHNGMEELDLKFERLVEIIRERERERERKREWSVGEVLTPVEEERRDSQDNETLEEDAEDGREREVHTWDF